MPLTSKKMVKLLKKNGFKVVSQSGSHIKMQNPITKAQTIIPYHSGSLKKELRIRF